MVQNGVGAAVERLQRWNDAAMMDPDEGGREQPGWQHAGQLGAGIVPGQGKGGSIQSFCKFF
jgi:hypothetical protein